MLLTGPPIKALEKLSVNKLFCFVSLENTLTFEISVYD
jgi:hypothetical protein